MDVLPKPEIHPRRASGGCCTCAEFRRRVTGQSTIIVLTIWSAFS
jgi:hypothetical protein